ncbi:MAG: hypothetical protein IJ659_01530 [Alloprevotella sp.]|nr:hypothetical protein [Alloprevotella sp.]
MRKLLLIPFILGAVAALVVACDDSNGNPGDFSLKATLSVDPVVVSVTGTEYPLNVARVVDTTYRYFYTESDTTKDADGKPVIGSDGKLIINVDTIWYNSKITAKLTEYELIELPAAADTFTIKLASNARWMANVPDAGGKVQWYFNYNLLTGATSLSGGGDGCVYFRVTRNKNYRRSVVAVQDIMTSDSTVIARLNFVQKGEKDN